MFHISSKKIFGSILFFAVGITFSLLKIKIYGPGGWCNDSYYMTTYELHELVSIAKDTDKYSDVKTDIGS